jgi:hypothetical protein
MALVNLAEYEARAREILPLPVFDYYYGGAHDEITVRESRRTSRSPGMTCCGTKEWPMHVNSTPPGWRSRW